MAGYPKIAARRRMTRIMMTTIRMAAMMCATPLLTNPGNFTSAQRLPILFTPDGGQRMDGLTLIKASCGGADAGILR